MIRFSIVIPTFNGAKRLPGTLTALLRQSVKPRELEIIVVNDGSTDDTSTVVEVFQQMHPDRKIILLFQPNSGPATARNTGIRYARGSVIFFIDDDCEPPALWMERHLTIYERYPEIVGIGGWYHPPLGEVKKNIYNLFHYLHYRAEIGTVIDRLYGKTGDFDPFPANNSGNLSVKKWALEAIKGFDERFPVPGYEDKDLADRLQMQGFSLYYEPLHIIHYKSLSLRRLLRLAFTRGRGMRVYYQLHYGQPIYHPAWWTMQRFKIFCQRVQWVNPEFSVDRRLLLLAFLFQLFQNWGARLSYQRKGGSA